MNKENEISLWLAEHQRGQKIFTINPAKYKFVISRLKLVKTGKDYIL